MVNCVNLCVCVHVCVHVRACVCVHASVHMGSCMCERLRMHMRVCACVCMCMHVWACVKHVCMQTIHLSAAGMRMKHATKCAAGTRVRETDRPLCAPQRVSVHVAIQETGHLQQCAPLQGILACQYGAKHVQEVHSPLLFEFRYCTSRGCRVMCACGLLCMRVCICLRATKHTRSKAQLVGKKRTE